MVRAIVNSVLVKVDWEIKREMQYGSLKLAINPIEGKQNDSYDPTGHRQTCGVVVSTPLGYDDHFLISRIHKDLVVGDKVYFHYNSIDEDTRIEIDGDTLYYVPYDMIFCAIRDGEPYMIGGRVLCEPYYDKDLVEIEHLGTKIRAKISPSGLVTTVTGWNPDSEDGHNLSKAVLAYIGKPLIGDNELPVKKGDVVYYLKNADFENYIEGKKYFVMMQEDLIMKEL
jgi:co-chaperonin GroES (HSP10)